MCNSQDIHILYKVTSWTLTNSPPSSINDLGLYVHVLQTINVFERHLLEDSNITRFHLSWLLMLSVAAPFDCYHVIFYVTTLKAFIN